MAMTLVCNALPLPCRIVEKTSANIVVKALSGRTSAVAKATEALLCFVELEQGDKVMVSGGCLRVHRVLVGVYLQDVAPQPLCRT